MKETVSSRIIEYLKGKSWQWGGKIEDHIRASMGSKASNASRICRSLAEAGILDRRLEAFEGSDGRKFVQYRIAIKDKLF